MLDERFAFVELALTTLPKNIAPQDRYPIAAFRSNKFLVTAYQLDAHPVYGDTKRLTVNRVQRQKDGRFIDGITWDELFTIKNVVGYAAWSAIEFYPPEKRLINVSNMRHLFLMERPLEFMWGASKEIQDIAE